MNSLTNNRIHFVLSAISVFVTFMMQDNLNPLNLGFNHSTLIVGVLSIYLAGRCFTKKKIEAAFILMTIGAAWLYVWIFRDRDFRWDNCIYATGWAFAICVLYLAANNVRHSPIKGFGSVASTFIISVICIISSLNSFIKSDTNSKPGPVTILSNGREPEVVGEEWADAERYNRHLLYDGFMEMTFGLVIGWMALAVTKATLAEQSDKQ